MTFEMPFKKRKFAIFNPAISSEFWINIIIFGSYDIAFVYKHYIAWSRDQY